ncbi:AAA-like domain-containing protein [Iningainema tapete]|uniref:AAA-like domain-containing protein n=1 Tax=Iningainema tapete BLCC-T55 TaxID=2748662 RepID=A0A8J7C825_9CYAN|nr:AAA-like domain-containing protein [Iningainema tapete]MBD2774031.1 AAA-like domain-containing protein [Iningainema tapete BLCC-T55]
MVDEYIFSGSLPENASTYVKRVADDELYEALTAGKFCYVLNSRQSGKSSLRVRIMSRLSEAGVECASIDLSSVSIQSATQENWYADLIVKLIDSFALDVDFKEWWEKNQLNSSLLRFHNFIEKKLLVEIRENIVIFIDEIDSVLSLNFPTDDFFAFVRACHNQRVDNPEYNRLTFCLLGVASPSNLIKDKNRTPFNIGRAITLKGFQLHEAEPLEKSLRGKFGNPQAIMKEILDWTGGQPFLTQKLCQFMIEESEKENFCTVEQVVRSRIIENWESQDEPEHLRTIRDRILRDEQRAGYLLELYQQIRLTEGQSEITGDDTPEQSDLQLAGLVVKQQNKLRVYNPIYQEVFDQNWIETQLRNLRPYSENFRFWVASGGKDESRYLRGKALQDALEWAKDKSLSYQDRQFLAASQTKEREEDIAAKEKEAVLEREIKDKEAAQKRNQVLTEANQKAQKRIRIGSVVLIVTLLGAAISGILALATLKRIEEQAHNLSALSNLSGELHSKNRQFEADEVRRQIGLSYAIKENYKLQQALLLSGIAFAYQKLERSEDAKQKIQDSMKLLQEEDIKNSPQKDEVTIHVLNIQGTLLKEQDNNTEAIEAYTKAFHLLKSNSSQLNPLNRNTQIINTNTVESVHRGLIQLLSTIPTQGNDLLSKVRESLKEYYYIELHHLLANKKWEAADTLTSKLMLHIRKKEEKVYLDIEDLNKFSCKDLQTIDQDWKNSSKGRFGFGVQKQIWLDTGNRPQEYNKENYTNFLSRTGWYDRERDIFLSYEEVIDKIQNSNYQLRGTLPTHSSRNRFNPLQQSFLAHLSVNCKI